MNHMYKTSRAQYGHCSPRHIRTKSIQSRSLALIWALLWTGLAFTASAATYVDVWRASDLGALANGAVVSSWPSASNRVASVISAGQEPTFVTPATPSGKPTLRFNGKLMRTSAGDNPAGGRTSFTLAYVFKANLGGDGVNAQWYNNTGIVDAEQPGGTADWGTAINSLGKIAFGMGNPDITIYNTGAGVVDGSYHVAVMTWGAGSISLYVDNQAAATTAGAAATVRNASPLGFGKMQTDVNAAFNGELAEVRFYAESLSSLEAIGVIREMATNYGLNIPLGVYIFAQPQSQSLFVGQPLHLNVGVSGAFGKIGADHVRGMRSVRRPS